MQWRQRSAWISVTLAVATACSGTPGGPGVDAGQRDAGADAGAAVDGGNRMDAGVDAGSFDAGALAVFCASVVPSACAYRVRCGLSADATSCAAYLRDDQHFMDPCLSDEKGVQAGRIQVDSAKLSACLQDIQTTAPCERELALDAIPDCEQFLIGEVADGQSCFIDAECSSNSYCASNAATCPGVCTTKRTLGQAADRVAECQPGLYVWQGSCQAPADAGSSCTNSSTPAQECVPGDFCDVYGTMTCQPSQDAGAACSQDDACSGSMFCLGGSVCGPLAVLDAGCNASTLSGAPLIACQPELHCVQPPPSSSPGLCEYRQPVTGSCAQQSDCVPGTFCSGGSCAPLLGLGATCNFFDLNNATECQHGLFCDQGSSQCLAQRALGGECMGPDECGAGLTCGSGPNDAGACVPDACHEP